MSQARSILQSPTQQQVHIYLRNSQKRAHFIKIKKQIEYDQIRRIISDRIKLPIQKLVLFLKGEQLSQHGKIILSEKNIVHLVNTDNVHREYINIHIKRLQGEKLLSHFKVDSKSNIKEFIDTKLQEVFKHNSQEIFLVYTGKQLDISKNWQDEFVEDQSELLCVNLDQTEVPVCEPSAITHHSKKKVDRSATEIELGPGKTYTESFIKKPAQSGNNAAPGSQQEIPVAPPNVWKKVNIPVESNPQDLKKPPNNTVPFQPKEETEHKLHSANRPRIEDTTQEERPTLRSENPEPEGQSAANDAAHSQGLRLQLEKEIPQESLERISQNIAVNAEVASAPAVTEVAESPIALEAEDEVPKKVESQPQEEEVNNVDAVATCQEHVQVVVQQKTENCQPNEAVNEEIPEKLESSPQETANVDTTVPAPTTIETVEEKITLDAEDEVPKVQSQPQEEQKQEHQSQPTHLQPQIQLRSGHHEQKQVSHQVVIEQVPNKLEEIALNIASNAVVAELAHEAVQVANDPIVLEAEDEAPKVESQPEPEVHHEEPYATQEEKAIEVEHHETVAKAEEKQAEIIANDKEAPQEIIYEAEDEAPKVESAPEPEAVHEETTAAKLESSPIVEEKLETIPVHTEQKAPEVHHEAPMHFVAASLIDQIKGKLNEKFKHEAEETKELKSEPQPILAEFNSANSLSSEVARCDLEGLISGTTKHVQELLAFGGEETEPLALALESAPTAQQQVVEETTSLRAGHHEDSQKPEEEAKHIEHEVVEKKHINVVENVESHPEVVNEQESSEVHQLILQAEAPEITAQHHEEINQELQHKEVTQQHQEIQQSVQIVHAHSVQHEEHRGYSAELHSAHKQPQVVVETQVVEEVNVPAVLESAPVPEQVAEVPHAEDNTEKPIVLEATTKEAVVEPEIPVAEDEAPRSALKSSPEAEHQPEHHETHEQAPIYVEHEEKPVEVEAQPIIEHHEQITEEVHNLHAVAQHQEPEHNDEVLHSHAPAHEEQTVQQMVQDVTTEHIEPTKEVHHEAVIDHQAEAHHQETHQSETHQQEAHKQQVHQQETQQQEVPAALESAPQEEEHSQIQKGEENNEAVHNEATEHKEPEAIEHIEATAEVEESPVNLESAPVHHEKQIIAEPVQKQEEAKTHVQAHHVPHIQAQLHTVEIQYEPEHQQIVDIVHEEHVQTSKENIVAQPQQEVNEEVHEDAHAVENPQISKNDEPEHIAHIEHVLEVTHEPAHVQHEVALHSAEHHQIQKIETDVVEEEPVHAALESSPEPVAEETHHIEANIPIVLQSKQQAEPKETIENNQEQPVDDDELPHSTISPNQTKEQAHVTHQALEQPIEVHHVVATLQKIEPLAILHHAFDHQTHDLHAQELIATHHEVETSLPVVEHPGVEKIQEVQEETAAPILHSAPEEAHEAINENEEHQHAQSNHSEVQHHQQKKQEVQAENEPEKLEENADVAVLQAENHEEIQHEVPTQPEHKVYSEPHQQQQVLAEHQAVESPEAHAESQQVEAHPIETLQVETKNLLFGAQHHIDLQGVDISNVLHAGISAALHEEPKQEAASHQEVEVVAEVEPVSAALESSSVNQEVHEEHTNDKAVVDAPIAIEERIEEHIEIAQTAATDDDIPHAHLESSPQEDHHEPEHHQQLKQAESHTHVAEEYIHQVDVPVKYDETPSVLKRTVSPHEANAPEQELEHQHSDQLDEKPREAISNPQTPQVVIGHEPTFATSFPQQQHQEAFSIQHQEVTSSSPVPAQVPSHTTDHLAQIDQFFNNNPIKLQALNNPLQSELNPSNSRLSDQSQGEFQKISVPMQEHIEFKAGDLIYSGEMHLNQTENLMQDILNDYSHLLAKSPQAFQETFGAHLK